VVYARTLGGKTYTFQVSGKLWRNSLIMQDRETGSSWSHVTGRAIDGKTKGAQLEKLEAVETTWELWYAAHPDTAVLEKSEEVLASHYQEYFDDPKRMGMFRAQWLTEKMSGKTLVYGAAVGPHAVAVTDTALAGGAPVQVDLGGTPVIFFRSEDGGVRAFIAKAGEQDAGSEREALAVTQVYWFAWSNFYPNTKVIE
jgi:hypothetical protein